MTAGRSSTPRRTGAECIRLGGATTSDPILLEFWQWSASDVLSNAQRGVFAEFLVAHALGVASGVRTEWDAFDLRSREGIKVEVKSSAYIQSWRQERLSPLSYGIAPRQGWDAETNAYSSAPARPADVYVFATLIHKDRATVDPLDLAQWEFMVLPTSVLDEHGPQQKTIRPSRLRVLGARVVAYADLPTAVREAGER